MREATQSSTLVRFGVFELDLRAGELRKQGLKVRLQERPFQILTFLLENRGEVVTREELRKHLWPADTFVDFDHSVNTAINKLRDALGDSPENPRFIETLPRHGYRFISTVDYASAGWDHRKGRAPTEPHKEKRRFAAVAVVAAAAIIAFETLVALNVAGLRDRLFRPVVPPKIESIAVLPLENLSGDPAQEYFADGMTEELITDLGKIRALRVISRTSMMRYKGTRKTIPEIGHELNVDAVLEGAVLLSGERVRITANLLYAPTDRHLWAQAYERDLGDVLALQSEVARTIASQIRAKVTPQENARLASTRPVNPKAHRLCLLGRFYWNKRTEVGFKKAIDLFQRAIEIDPAYAPAYAGLADSYAMLGAGYYAVLPPREAYPKAKAAATQALRLDSTLAEAHSTLAWSKVFFDWDWQGGEREFKRAIELNPGYANAHHWYALLLTIVGRHSEAIAEGRRAESLDPLSLIISSDVAMEVLGPAGLYEQEMQQCRKTLEMDATFPLAHACLSESYKHLGRYKEAIAEMVKAIDLSGGSAVWVSELAEFYALAGRRAEAVKILNELTARSRREYVAPDLFADIYASLGENDQAFAWIEKAYEERSDLVGRLKVGRNLDPLRPDPRYQNLLRRMNFPP